MKKIFNSKFPIVAVAVAMMFLLSSCAFFSKYTNRENSMKLRKGMTKQEVLAVMGEPLRGKHFNQPDIWFYYIETRWAFDCQITRDECLPIIFKDGKIQGWGVEYYKQNVEIPGSK